MVPLPSPLVRGVFVRRINRFAILVQLDDGALVVAHLPNSGRLREVLRPRTPFWLAPRSAAHRCTLYDAVLAQDGTTLVCVDARLPPRLLVDGILSGAVPEFGKVRAVKAEVPLNAHRIDLLLHADKGRWWVETKSVTLVVDGVALFPDAPTVRGQQHLHLLTQLCRNGHRAAVVFVIQRPDARCLRPHATADPQFAAALRAAADAGVAVRAYTCAVTFTGVGIACSVPVRL